MEVPARKSYRSDLSDAQWSILEPLIPACKHGGRHREIDMREVLNTILYLNRTGCQWDMLPHDLLPKSSVYDYFAAWRDDGTWLRMTDALRAQVRVAEGREPTPSAASIDSQTVKTTELGGPRGYDGGKKITGRKRHILVDTLGLLLAVVVTQAALDDAAAAPLIFQELRSERMPRLEVVWADGKYHNHALNAWLETFGRRGDWRSSPDRPASKDSPCCPNVGSRNARLLGTAGVGGIARITNDERIPASRWFASRPSD